MRSYTYFEALAVTLKKPYDRIALEPGKRGGKPCIRGLRISVQDVLSMLANYPDRAQLFANCPDL